MLRFVSIPNPQPHDPFPVLRDIGNGLWVAAAVLLATALIGLAVVLYRSRKGLRYWHLALKFFGYLAIIGVIIGILAFVLTL